MPRILKVKPPLVDSLGRAMRPLSDRFWEKVDVRGPDECWPWKAGLSGTGYGSIGRGGRGSNAASHVIAYELQKGAVPPGLRVLHSCDNRPCCNGAHLFAGTQRRNMLDKELRKRGNHAKGEKNHAKLTTQAVKQIRILYATGQFSYEKLGKEFDVSHTTIRNIVLGRKWKHATTGATQKLGG